PVGKDPSEQEVRAIERLSYVDLHQRLLEEFAPPSVVVNEEYDIVHLSEHAGEFLQIRGGGPTNNLLRLIRPELRLDVRTALYQALQKGEGFQRRAIDVSKTHGTKRVNVLVRPVLREGDPSHGFILLVFQEKTKATQEAPTVTLPVEPIARQLEDELMNAKSQLRATVEQYEIQQEKLGASNKKLQAMNETFS